MAKFHRFVDPTYFGAPTLAPPPASALHNGAEYDRLNVISGGTGSGGSSFADGPKASGPNASTYFVAFGEDATSSNTNRGLKALAENTDFLDDLMNRDIAIPVRTNTVTAGSPLSSLVLPTGTFVGHTGSYPLDMLFSIVDQDDREIIIHSSGTEVKVSSISGAAVGDGFSTAPVILNLSTAIPAGTQYRVYYASRGNLATMPVDALSFIRVRGAEEVDADVEHVLRKIQAPLSESYAWNSTPLTTLFDLGWSGLNETWHRCTVRLTETVSYHPVGYTLNAPGAGGYYIRREDGPGMAAHSVMEIDETAGYLGHAEHYLGAMWAAVMHDHIWPNSLEPAERTALSSGFVFLGGRRVTQDDFTAATPGLFSFFHGTRQTATNAGHANDKTHLKVGDVVTIAADGTITLPATSWFRKNISGQDRTALAKGYDILRVQVGANIHNLVLQDITGYQTAIFRHIDNASWGGGATSGTIVEWIQPLSYMGDGAPLWSELRQGQYAGNQLHGFLWADPPGRRYGAPSIGPSRARFFGRNNSSPAVVWGCHNELLGINRTNGFLHGDGSIEVNDIYSSGMLTVEGSAFFNGYTYFDEQVAFLGPVNIYNSVTISDDQTLFQAGFDSEFISDGSAFFSRYVRGESALVKRVREASVAITGVSPTVDMTEDVGSAGSLLFWKMDGTNGTTDTASITINGIAYLGFVVPVIRLVIRRTSASRMKKISITTPGFTTIIDPEDRNLLPVQAGATYMWDVYEGYTLNAGSVTAVVWTVKRTVS